MNEDLGGKKRIVLLVAAILALVVVTVYVGVALQKSTDEHARQDGSGIDADSSLRAALVEIEMPSLDFSNADEVQRWVRVVSKQLIASGQYDEAEQVQIKYAVQDAESALDEPGLSDATGRAIVKRYLDVLEAI